MYSFRNRALLRARPVGLAATAALALALTLFAAPVAAHDDEHEAAAKPPPVCTEAEKKKLEKAKDNFSEACAPSKNLAEMNDSAADLPVGDQAAEDMELLKNLPKNGAFAAETAFNSDLAFQGKYAYAGNYEGFSVYDLSNPESPEQVAQVICPGSQNDVSVYKRRAGALDGLQPQQQHLHQHRAAGHREELVGGPEGLRHQRPDEPAVHRRGGDPVWIAHAHPRAEQERQEPVGLRVVVLPERHVPGLPAAARPDQRGEDRDGQAGDGQAHRHPGAVPRWWQPGRQLLAGDQRLPRHHRLPVEGHRCGRLHG